MPFQPDPPPQVQRQKPDVKQESTGPNSPNIVTGDNSTINIGPKLSGLLEPSSNGTRPAFRVSIPDSALVISFGGQIVYSTQPSFLVVRFGGEDLLSVKRVGLRISVSARVYSPDGKIVADIENNEFTVNPNNYFKIKHPDKSTLSVYNQLGEESLNVAFVAPGYMVVTGIFHKGERILKATANALQLLPQNMTLSNGFMGEIHNGAAFAF